MTIVTEQASSGGKKNKQLLLIVAIAVLTTLVPYIMYYTGVGVPQGTTNEGILLSDPVVATDFAFRDVDGQPWPLADQRPKFRLVVPVHGACEQACRDSLYLTRQVRTRLSDKRDQLERVFVQLGEPRGEDFKQYLEVEHPDLRYLQGDYQEWREALGDEAALKADFSGQEYYLLHRYGALAMAYNEQHSGNQLLEDLNFLIKTSN